jgi:hypothetical protein
VAHRSWLHWCKQALWSSSTRFDTVYNNKMTNWLDPIWSDWGNYSCCYDVVFVLKFSFFCSP